MGAPSASWLWTARITDGGQTLWVGAISASGADWYSSIQIQSQDPVDAASLADLGVIVADLVEGA